MFQLEVCKMVRLTIIALCMSRVGSITQFIAALGSPSATSGNNAHLWGFWPVDPGPRGVYLKDFNEELADGVAPAGWQFNISDWYVEEYGRIMEKPNIPIQPGTYTVTVFQGGGPPKQSSNGFSPPTTELTIHPKNQDGTQLWELDGVQLADVTHGPCRTGRYTPDGSSKTCSPANMPQNLFPVTPGGLMPTLEGCVTQDYRVLFVSAPSSEAKMSPWDGSAFTNPAPSSEAEASTSDGSTSSSGTKNIRQVHQLLVWLVSAALLSI